MIEYQLRPETPDPHSQLPFKKRFIPSAYIRILHQFCAETLHADHNRAHEAQRRASYALRVLNAFGDELNDQRAIETDGRNAVAWRSKVLTPILQRHLCGVPDSYGPSICNALLPPAGPEGHGSQAPRKVTIRDATSFYLGRDPTHHSLAPIYYRNLVYRHEARWHLGIVFQVVSVDDVKYYLNNLNIQRSIMREIAKTRRPEGGGIPPLGLMEYVAVTVAGLGNAFFRYEPDVSTMNPVRIVLTSPTTGLSTGPNNFKGDEIYCKTCSCTEEGGSRRRGQQCGNLR